MIDRLSALFSSSDMTVGNPMTCLLRFSIPLLIGNLAQQLYSTVDSIVVGQYVGDKALSAIGTTLPIINLLLVLFIAISTGTSIMVAQYFGAREKRLLSHSVGNAITLILLSSVIIMVIGIPLSSPLLELTNTPVETFDMAHSYLVIILAGVFFSGLYNILSGVLRGLGNSVYPLFVLLIASVLNIFLDIWFVAGLEMGVGGAALATIISQAVSAVLCLFKLVRMKDTLVIDKSTLTPNRDLISQLMRLGLPAGITQVIFSMSMVFVQSLTNSMGYKVVTCTTAVMRIDGFAMMPNFTFGMAIATFVGQNIGANRLDRIEQGRKDVLKISLTTSLILVTLLLLFGENLIRLFTSTEEIINLGVRQIRILAFGYVAMAISQVFAGIMRGAGDTMPSMWISMVTTVCVRVPVAYLWAYFTKSPKYPAGSPDALFFSLLISWVTGAVLNYLWYRRGTWKEKSLIRYSAMAE
ncbi:MAG TPA: MATE family efflux transporter [Bacillota bacterium]|mgnify:CR=1 FL=1|nr:MATE family efflux transporter [Bacillota bacterium]HRC53488.1 MATE family efflux transporter [Bacillota bacterium]